MSREITEVWSDEARELDLIFERAKARSNLNFLKLYEAFGMRPPIVRWMPKPWWRFW